MYHSRTLTAPRTAALVLFGLSLGVGAAACTSAGPGSEGAALAGAPGYTEADIASQHTARYEDGNIPQPAAGGAFRDIRFDSDSSTIDSSAQQAIADNARILKLNEGLRVQLEGYCDSQGTGEYSLALGARRAQAVQAQLESLGVASERLTVISFGAELPLNRHPTEAAWQQNRRVHFSAYPKPAPLSEGSE